MSTYQGSTNRWSGLKSRGASLGVGLLVLVATLLWAGAAQADQATFNRAQRALSAWQMTEAREAIDELAARSDGPYVDYLQGRYAFYDGDYEEALELLDAALSEEDRSDWRRMRDLVEATLEVTADYERHVSPSGRFEIYVEPGRDEVLLPYAFDALEKAYEELGQEIDHRPDQPVRVEVYPRESVLAQVSMLTEDNIRTSGTIALCQYNRLMITSPRAVLRGYGWVDTLVHEYVHLIINQRTTEDVPIWMHEGLAKYLERRWRGDNMEMLDASAEHLLQERMDDDDLIPFEDMHPSMAMLPSQQDAAVAFAQVYTTMEYLRNQGGTGAFGRLLDTINEGYSAQDAYARVLDTSWTQFEGQIWPSYLQERPVPDLPDDGDDIYEERLVFDDEAAEKGDELDNIEVPEAREHMTLGQMFQVRERFGAAAVQYGKAVEMLGNSNPVLQTRMAKTLTLSGSPQEAIEALERVQELYPGYLSTWLELGRAQLAAEQHEEARQSLEEAARINPFNPEVHDMLARVYRHLGESDKADVARRAAALARQR